MSTNGYINMNHAGWMQSHIESCRRSKIKMHPSTPETLNEFQRKVVNIIGIVGGGIYNAPINREKIDWKYGYNGISVIWQREMASWDFNQLTWLVFLCHEARIRCCISGCANNLMRLSFWPRADSGDTAVRHPNLEEAMEIFRNAMGVNHYIRYGYKVSESNV